MEGFFSKALSVVSGNESVIILAVIFVVATLILQKTKVVNQKQSFGLIIFGLLIFVGIVILNQPHETKPTAKTLTNSAQENTKTKLNINSQSPQSNIIIDNSANNNTESEINISL
jgi:amino acid permease